MIEIVLFGSESLLNPFSRKKLKDLGLKKLISSLSELRVIILIKELLLFLFTIFLILLRLSKYIIP